VTRLAQNKIRMTSLQRYLAVVGLTLLVITTLISFLLEPSTGARIVSAPLAEASARNGAHLARLEQLPADRGAAKAAETCPLPNEAPADAVLPGTSEPPGMRTASAALSDGAAEEAAARAKAARTAAIKAKLKAERRQRQRAARARERAQRMAMEQRQRQGWFQPAPTQPVDPFGWRPWTAR
jgi:hypothetical protein